MPLYDCMLLVKPNVGKDSIVDLVSRVAKHVYRKNGVVTDLKSHGTVQLGYGIRKLDGRYYQGQLMRMTMMTSPSINSELSYLNKEDRLLRWLLIKHRGTNFGGRLVGEDVITKELQNFKGFLHVDDDMIRADEDDDDEDDDGEDDEPAVGEHSESEVV